MNRFLKVARLKQVSVRPPQGQREDQEATWVPAIPALDWKTGWRQRTPRGRRKACTLLLALASGFHLSDVGMRDMMCMVTALHGTCRSSTTTFLSA